MNHLKTGNENIEVTTLHDARFLNTLELAVRFGKTLVILEADRVHVSLYPLLRKDLIRQGPRFVVQIGDKLVDYNESFQLYQVSCDALF